MGVTVDGGAAWEQVSQGVGHGLVSPLAVVGRLADLTDGALLRLDVRDALGVIETTRAAVAALEAVQALAVEAYAQGERAGRCGPEVTACKTHTAWRYVLEPDGTCRWVSPFGRRYVTVPDLPRDLAA